MTIQAIEKEVMKLDAIERAKLATRLLSSLDELSETENEQLWAAEAVRRHEELLKGKAKSKSSSVVFKNTRERLQ